MHRFVSALHRVSVREREMGKEVWIDTYGRDVDAESFMKQQSRLIKRGRYPCDKSHAWGWRWYCGKRVPWLTGCANRPAPETLDAHQLRGDLGGT